MDKIALITGCNRGIGKATMELFIQNGISVIACTRILSDSLIRLLQISGRKV